MATIERFEDIRGELDRRVQRTIWTTMATVDRQGRPRTRIVHPVWNGPTGYLATRPESLKLRHLQRNPYASFSYWDPNHEQVAIECRATVTDAMEDKLLAWETFKRFPEPYGFDPASIPGWESPDAPGFVVVRLEAWRVLVFGFGKPHQVWRASD